MTVPAHLNDEQVAQYLNRTLTPIELLDLDAHVSACAVCRERLYSENRAGAAVRSIRAEMQGHLEYADIVSCSEGMATEEQRAHLRDCPMCQGEVLDLSRFRTELQETRRAPATMPKRDWTRLRNPLGIAAAVLLIAGAGVWSSHRSKPAPAPLASQKPVEAPLPPAERQMLDLAIASNRFERAPVLDRLIAKKGTLLGSKSETGTFDLLAPLGTTVLTDRPVLRWTPLNGASTYVVSIFDEHFNRVAESPAIGATDWRPASPLPRGQVLYWQVSANLGGRSIHAPAPPAPEARFEVVAQEVSDRIEAVRREHPGNPLLLAVLCANAGALDDAELVLQGMDGAAAQHYKESLQKLRKP
jgi:hypothetical protein